jgi:hypothetical protein
MRLVGQEIGFDNNAKERDIVVHAAHYVGDAVFLSPGPHRAKYRLPGGSGEHGISKMNTPNLERFFFNSPAGQKYK